MIISFTCSCGNTDPKNAKHYDGCLGYEAIVCTECGTYYDNEGEHEPDDFSIDFISGSLYPPATKEREAWRSFKKDRMQRIYKLSRDY